MTTRTPKTGKRAADSSKLTNERSKRLSLLAAQFQASLTVEQRQMIATLLPGAKADVVGPLERLVALLLDVLPEP